MRISFLARCEQKGLTVGAKNIFVRILAIVKNRRKTSPKCTFGNYKTFIRRKITSEARLERGKDRPGIIKT